MRLDALTLVVLTFSGLWIGAAMHGLNPPLLLTVVMFFGAYFVFAGAEHDQSTQDGRPYSQSAVGEAHMAFACGLIFGEWLWHWAWHS